MFLLSYIIRDNESIITIINHSWQKKVSESFRSFDNVLDFSIKLEKFQNTENIITILPIQKNEAYSKGRKIVP